MIPLDIIEANYNNEEHADEVLRLTDMYARDAMGMGKTLPNATKLRLIDRLQELENAFTLLAYKDSAAIGIANCLITFSTFEARKVINIHDLAVEPDWRGLGIGKQLLQEVQKRAKELKCCRITLEVREDNPAKDLYERYGFDKGEPHMLYMSKELY